MPDSPLCPVPVDTSVLTKCTAQIFTLEGQDLARLPGKGVIVRWLQRLLPHGRNSSVSLLGFIMLQSFIFQVSQDLPVGIPTPALEEPFWEKHGQEGAHILTYPLTSDAIFPHASCFLYPLISFLPATLFLSGADILLSAPATLKR